MTRFALLLTAAGCLSACTSAPEGPVTETGELATGDLTLTGGELQDTFPVRASDGQWIKVDLRSTAFDPYLILRTPDEQQSENDDASEDDTEHSQVIYQAVQGGQFQIIVTSYESGESGAYTLTYEVTDTQPAGSTPPAGGRVSADEDPLGGGVQI